MEDGLITIAYLVASVLFILSLRGLSSQETARRGNLYGIVGMLVALAAAATSESVAAYVDLGLVMAAGGAVGAFLAVRVAMTAMPELVAILHSFVGLAAVLVGFASYMGADAHVDESGGGRTILLIEIFIDVFIGALTFTGSVIAFAKLRGTISGRALLLPGRHAMNLVAALGCIGLAIPFVAAPGTEGVLYLLGVAAISSVLGVHLVMAIGGADMPVVVSMLNSYSGWTAAAAGFMLENDLLIITGALVGSSGAILSIIMCRAMNRSIVNVMFGGFGATPVKKRTGDPGEQLEVQETDAEAVAAELLRAQRVVVVPGYGMAVARAQHAVQHIAEMLRDRGTEVRFGIHPVAGRLPGHMNVLLAEANVPYDIVLEMEEINDDFADVDVSLVLGANDIVNPGAETDETSPIYGMPVLKVWESDRVVICKRGRAAGYAGVDNPLFYHDRTHMLFGDARDSMEALVAALRQRLG